MTVQREERRETGREGAEAGGRCVGRGKCDPRGKARKATTVEEGWVAFPSVPPSPRHGWGAAGDDGDGAGGASWETLQGPPRAWRAWAASVYRLRYCLLGTLGISTDTNGSGSLPFHTSGALWNHKGPRFKRPSPRYTTEVVSAADIPHYQRPSLYPEFLHSSTVWGSWESWLPGHVCQPPILSGHCRPAKFASSTHPAIFFPVAQHQHGPSYLRFLTLQATYKPSSRHTRDKFKLPLS